MPVPTVLWQGGMVEQDSGSIHRLLLGFCAGRAMIDRRAFAPPREESASSSICMEESGLPTRVRRAGLRLRCLRRRHRARRRVHLGWVDPASPRVPDEAYRQSLLTEVKRRHLGRLAASPAVLLRMAFQCARRGARFDGLIRWVVIGAWDESSASVFLAGHLRAQRPLPRRAEAV
jgi:hypothetical protein